MSLLMEALRKAEEAKRKGQGPRGNEPAPENESTAFSLVPDERDSRQEPQTTTPEAVPSASEPDLDTGHAAELHDELHYEADPESIPAPTTRKRVRVNQGNRQSESQLAAASIFAAKQPATANSTYLKPVLLSVAVLLPLVGAGLWYLQQTRSSGGILLNPDLANVDLAGRTLDTSPMELPTEDSATGTAAPEVATEPDTASATEAILPITAAEPEPEPAVPVPTAEPEAEPVLATAEPAPAAATPDASPEQQTTPAVPQAPVAAGSVAVEDNADTGSRLQVSRSREPATVNATLQSAWNTLQAGDTGTAERLYAEVLVELPNNRDAILGLAVIHTQNGRLDAARRLYAQALTLNPQDPLARTGLLQTMAGTSSEIERELLSLRDNFPQLAPIHFALGNLYAARQSWNDAQGAYFDALVLASRSENGPVSPDYAFNLAVSLEQLQQPRAALDYYRQAQTLAQERAPGFDPALLRARLAILEQNLP